eukprot:s3780_g10.t1
MWTTWRQPSSRRSLTPYETLILIKSKSTSAQKKLERHQRARLLRLFAATGNLKGLRCASCQSSVWSVLLQAAL